jgi:hypothetical protein
MKGRLEFWFSYFEEMVEIVGGRAVEEGDARRDGV